MNDANKFSNEKDAILLVSDNAALFDYFLDIFSKEPYQIFTAKETRDAFQILEKSKIKVVICEHHFPGMDGVEFLKKVKDKHPNIIKIILSMEKEFNMLVRAINECGIYNFIPKDLAIDECKKIIKEALIKYAYMEKCNLLSKDMSQKNIELETLNIHLEERFYEKTSQLLNAKKELEEANINLKNNLSHLSVVRSKLDRRVRELEVLNSLGIAFSPITATINEFLTHTLESAITLFEAETGFLVIEDSKTKEIEVRIAVGNSLEKIKDEKAFLRNGVFIDWIYRHNKPVLIKEVKNDPRFDYKAIGIEVLESIISVPLVMKDKIYGVMVIINNINGGSFSDEDLNFLITLAGESGIAIERDVLYNDLQRSYIETLYGLVNAIEAKDTYTRGHTERVEKIASYMADKMAFSEHDKEILKHASVLHDIGKIGIDNSILRKPGKLDNEEFDLIKKHPLIGEKIIEPIQFLRETLPLIRGHHERLDGSGYPDGLKNEELSQMLQIIAIADVFEALTSDRSYRKAMSNKDAMAILKKDVGKFNVQMIEVLEQIIIDIHYRDE